ncbi:MAG TPA: DUF2254 domain-containing protein [Bryobacteraceae bacterium]|nr:DUF2254 domain-containing protein [Bryobacteraceae bacterium]
MDRRLPLVIRQVMYNLRGGFLVRPLIIALSLGCAGAVLSWIEEVVPGFSDFVPKALFPSHADPQVAQVILGDIATSTMTVVSIVFAILLMTLTLASMQFSPRIIVSFSRDRVTQWTLGIFLGTFCYCMTALPAARSFPRPFAPVATVLGAMLLAVACVGWLLFFIHHISQAISVNHIVDRIATETEAIIDDMMPFPHRLEHAFSDDPRRGYPWETTILNEVSGYIRFIDIPRLVALAKSQHIKIDVLRRVGHFVPAGVPLMLLSKGDRMPPEVAEELLASLDFGPTRTLQQDVEFGVLQIVDIALKAISPAVNDPTTAIGSVDQLGRILIRFASRETPDPMLYDPPGLFRAHVSWLGFEQLLDSAFEQIRLYSRSDVAVSLRLLRALTDIAITTQDAAYRKILAARGRRIVEGCAGELGEEELKPIRARAAALENLVASPLAVNESPAASAGRPASETSSQLR